MPPSTATNTVLLVVGLVGAGFLLYFDFNQVLMTRLIGVVVCGFGAWGMLVRRIPYGGQGEEPRYLEGAGAVLLGLMVLAIGLFAVLAPLKFMQVAEWF